MSKPDLREPLAAISPYERDPREAKLPAWARAELAQLRQQVVSWRTAALGVGKKDSPLSAIVNNREELGIPEDASVRFRIGKHNLIEVRFAGPQHAPSTIAVSTDHGPIALHPRASNLIHVTGDSR